MVTIPIFSLYIEATAAVLMASKISAVQASSAIGDNHDAVLAQRCREDPQPALDQFFEVYIHPGKHS